MNLIEYIVSKEKIRPNADIVQRWQTRILARGLHNGGAEGARVYLRDYGKGIAAPKVLMLARQAMDCGAIEMARAFYVKAAQLEGIVLEVTDIVGATRIETQSPTPETPKPAANPSAQWFPQGFRAGEFAPMQPNDAVSDRAFYVRNPGYWGQPKIDGNKLIVFATANECWYQSRQMKLSGPPSVEMDAALKRLAKTEGPFILEGELTYLDCHDKEHRTGSQAATYNCDAGMPQVQPAQIFYVFSSPWAKNAILFNYGDMVKHGERLATKLSRECPIRPLITAMTTQEKLALCEMQQNGGREGEVWFRHDMQYLAGKNRRDNFVRTKYLTEFTAVVTGFTETMAEGHAFGAMNVSSLEGKSLGSIGTGFTREDKYLLKQRFEQSGPFQVEIRSQGFTESGAVWHGRFLRVV